MKLTSIEEQLQEYMNSPEVLEASSPSMEASKGKIWRRINGRISRDRQLTSVWWFTAAAVLVLCTMEIFFLGRLDSKNAEIARLKTELLSERDSGLVLRSEVAEIKSRLWAEENKPTVVDTVYLTRIVYRETRVDKEYDDPIKQMAHRETQNGQNVRFNTEMDNIDFALLKDDGADIQIEYGAKTKDGFVPWKFTVKYQ